MDNLNPIQDKRTEFKQNLTNGFQEPVIVSKGQDLGSAMARQAMTAGRINEQFEKGLQVGGEMQATELTPANATTIAEVAELIKGGQWEFFSRNNISQFQEDLRKSLDSEEISYKQFTEDLREINKLEKTLVKGVNGEEVNVYYRRRTVTLQDLSKSVDYKERLEKLAKGNPATDGEATK